MAATKRRWPGPERAPFRRGSLLEWVHPSDAREQVTADDHYAKPDEWRDNAPFWARLTLAGTERGRSAARFTWADTSAMNFYPMFITDVAALMMRPDGVRAGVVDGWWIVTKRGQNYGLMAIDPPEGNHD